MKQNYVTLQHNNSYTLSAILKFYIPIAAGLLFIFASQPAPAADDDYLRALQSEAGENAAPTMVAASDKYLDALSAEAEASAHVADNAKDTSAEERREMEALLEKEKPTTFKYYKKLKPQDKAKLAEDYRTDPADKATKFSHLQKKILDLYFKH